MLKSSGISALVVIATGLVFTIGCASAPSRVGAPSQTASRDAPSARAVAVLPSPTSDASPGAPQADEPEPEAVTVPIEGSELLRGRAKVKVKAPLSKVREAVLDFGHYAEFMPHYKNCKVLGRTSTGARDLYMEIEALNGVMTMWAEVELPKPVMVDGVETHETSFIKGNVKDFKAIWRLHKLDAETTELELEVFLEPGLPMPTALLNNENLKGAIKGVAAMRSHAEGRN